MPPDIAADIQPLRAETAPAVVLPDYVAVIRIGLADPIIFHAEFQSKYHHDLPRDMARCGGSLSWQHQMPIESVLILLRPQGVPARIPKVGHYNIGNARTSCLFRVVAIVEDRSNSGTGDARPEAPALGIADEIERRASAGDCEHGRAERR